MLMSFVVSIGSFCFFVFFCRFSSVIYNFAKKYLGYVQLLFFLYKLSLFVDGQHCILNAPGINNFRNHGNFTGILMI